MKTFERVAACAGLAVLALGTGCASIVKKPEVGQVKRAAIISLYANQKVPKSGGRGAVTGWDEKFKHQVAGEAIHIAAAEFGKIGWAVINPDKVVQSEEYQAAFRPKPVPGVSPKSTVGRALSFVQTAAQDLHARAFFTPAGMQPVQIDDKSANTTYLGNNSRDPKQILAKFARQLNVDAVIVVQLDYCYQGGTYSMLGNGEAVVTAASSVKAINQNGELVINMPSIQECGGDRMESKGTATMIGGDLVFAKMAPEGFRKMFAEATALSVAATMQKIQEAMH